jgi:hypothetical protein
MPVSHSAHTILKLEPRDDPERIETIDPLVRGAMFHEIQFEVLPACASAARYR